MLYGRRNLTTIGRAFNLADADEVVVPRPENGQLALVKVIASVPGVVVGDQTVTLKAGTQTIGWWKIAPGDTRMLLWAPFGLPIDGALVARATNVGVIVTAWAIEVQTAG